MTNSLVRCLAAPVRQLGDVARVGGDMPVKILAVNALMVTAVTRVLLPVPLLTMQQIGVLLDVKFVSHRGGKVDQPTVDVHHDVYLHAEVLLLVSLGLFAVGLIEGIVKLFYPEAPSIVVFVIMVIVLII